MPSTDPLIDAYIKKSAPFAQPILQHLRKLVHKACPQVHETMKWSFPHFDYKGIMCSMASFKNHCSFVFWKASLMKDDKRLLKQVGNTDMAYFDKIISLKDLPPDEVLMAYIREAVRLNEEDVKLPAKQKAAVPKELPVPEEFLIALKKNKNAMKAFENFSPSQKKEYIEWIADAKTESTRNKRIETSLEWISEGKIRHWKYVKSGGTS